MYSDVAVHFTGNVIREPELKDVNGAPVLSFYVAASNGIKKEDGSYGSDFFNCSVWGVSAKYMSSKIQKGTSVEVNGCLTLQAYVSDKDKLPHYEARVTVFNMKPRSRTKTEKRVAKEEEAKATE